MNEEFSTPDTTSRAAVALARSMGLVSRAWGQKGLGTLFGYLGRLPVVGASECVATLAPGTRFALPVFDPYWGPTVIAGRPFEPELGHILRRLRGCGATFVDCGANFGYWSVIATGPEIGFRDAVAIEPNPPTFQRLTDNARLNGDRFRCLQRAISDVSGRTVNLTWADRHVVSHVSEEAGSGIAVETISLDDVVAQMGWSDHPSFVLKLDVEGQELKAVAGAAKLRQEHDHLIVFEDFPGESNLGVMRGLLPMGYAIFYVNPAGSCRRVEDPDHAKRLVAADGKGTTSCNFVATRSEGPARSMFARMREWTEERGG